MMSWTLHPKPLKTTSTQRRKPAKNVKSMNLKSECFEISYVTRKFASISCQFEIALLSNIVSKSSEFRSTKMKYRKISRSLTNSKCRCWPTRQESGSWRIRSESCRSFMGWRSESRPDLKEQGSLNLWKGWLLMIRRFRMDNMDNR